MKWGNLANRFLFCLVVVVVGCGAVVRPISVVPAPDLHPSASATMIDVTGKQYYFETQNRNILKKLSLTDYHEYLQHLNDGSLPEVVVAVVDSGLDNHHEVFNNRIYTQYARNFNRKASGSDWNTDLMGHGTHVAGIIAESTLPNVKILPIRIFVTKEEEDAPLWTEMYAAIEHIIKCKKQLKLNIVACNLSLGTDASYNNDSAHMCDPENNAHLNTVYHYYETLINTLRENDILPVVASGNAGQPVRVDSNGVYHYFSYPSGVAGAVAVSAYNQYSATGYGLASFSNYGPHISLSAPGVSIWSAGSEDFFATNTTWPSEETPAGKIISLDGTSMATPYVTSAYAMLCSDLSRTKAADFGVEWNATTDSAYPYYYLNYRHKALLLSAKKMTASGIPSPKADAPNTAQYGYGCLSVTHFAKAVPAETDETYQLDSVSSETVLTPLPAEPASDVEPYQDPNTNDSGNFSFIVWLVLGGMGVYFLIKYLEERVRRRSQS